MFTPWQWGRTSHAGAVANARSAATELSRRRVERDEVELYLAARAARAGRGGRPGGGRAAAHPA